MSEVSLLLLGLTTVSAVYWLAALIAARGFGRLRVPSTEFHPPVTVLKPLCGADQYLYENLRSFCEQNYPGFQVIFGVRASDDPAIRVVRRLIREFPDRDLTLVISDRLVGANLKVSNLANLYQHAKYRTLVLSDSDIRVGPDYLRMVVAPLEDRRVGLVTCLYKGVATDGIWSTLGAMFINEWFFPSALVATRLETLRYGFGATLACRKEMIEAIGGFESLAGYLADDYMLGRLLTSRGFSIVLSPYVVETVVVERQFTTLFFHELRWTRTFRTARPLGYLLSVVTYGLPLSLLLLVASRFAGVAVIAFIGHLVLRLINGVVVRRVLRAPGQWSVMWLVPMRDALSFTLWILSFVGRSVRWNGHRFRVHRDGTFRLIREPGAGAVTSTPVRERPATG